MLYTYKLDEQGIPYREEVCVPATQEVMKEGNEGNGNFAASQTIRQRGVVIGKAAGRQRPLCHSGLQKSFQLYLF